MISQMKLLNIQFDDAPDEDMFPSATISAEYGKTKITYKGNHVLESWMIVNGPDAEDEHWEMIPNGYGEEISREKAIDWFQEMYSIYHQIETEELKADQDHIDEISSLERTGRV